MPINTADQQSEQALNDGDMALIIPRRGNPRVYHFGVDVSRLDGPQGELTEDDFDVLEQGQKVFALMIAAKSPMIMKFLIEIAAHPDAAISDALDSLKRIH
jgi:hypothetical protein